MPVVGASGHMLGLLARAEQQLPYLLRSFDIWQTLLIDDEKPYVMRAWTTFRDGRIFLHRLHPCGDGEALYHPHPWESAVVLKRGRYRSLTGAWPNPLTYDDRIYTAGDRYEMTDLTVAHSVQPLVPTYSVMVTGPYVPGIVGARKGRNLRKLTNGELKVHLHQFRKFYPLRLGEPSWSAR